MKKIVNGLLGLLLSGFCAGQSQAIEQLALDLEKLAQMKAMLNSMYHEYATLTTGYNTITGLAKGNYDLHRSYLDGLFAVHSSVKKDSHIETILSNYSLVGTESSKAYAGFVKSMILSSAELVSIKLSLNSIQSSCNTKMDALQKVLTPGLLRMSDAERIAAIDRIDHDVGELLAQERKLVSDKQALVTIRSERKRNVEVMKKLNGIKR